MKITTKRLLAYIIDMLIVFSIVFLINLVLPTNINEINLSTLNEKYLSSTINFSQYMDEYIPLIHNIDLANVGINILSTILLVTFFIVIPLLKNGQTIGCMIFKIRINSKEELKVEHLVGRSVIVNGLGYMFLILIIIFFVNDLTYFILMNFLAIFQIIVVIINGFMVLYKKEHLGIADKLTKTRIEEIK